jgi:hypothetical protein
MGDQTVYIRFLPYKAIKEKLGRLMRRRVCGGGRDGAKVYSLLKDTAL